MKFRRITENVFETFSPLQGFESYNRSEYVSVFLPRLFHASHLSLGFSCKPSLLFCLSFICKNATDVGVTLYQ